MAPQEVPVVEVYAGDTTSFNGYTFKTAGNVARDLVAEGWGTWRAQWREEPESAVAIDLIVDATDAATGTIRVSATAALTATMPRDGYWDLQALRGASEVRTFVWGATRFMNDVTRP
jgi:hypothetical protein